VIDFVGRRAFYYTLSILIMLPGIISLVLPGGLTTGIEFSSGSSFTARFQQPINEDQLRQALTDFGHENSRVQKAGDRYLSARTSSKAPHRRRRLEPRRHPSVKSSSRVSKSASAR